MFGGNFEELAAFFKEKLGDNFAYLIGAGSYGIGKGVTAFSDIDFVLVVNNINYFEKCNIYSCFNKIKDKYSLKIGGVVVSKSFLEERNPNLLTLDGKIIQSIIEVNLGYQKIFGCDNQKNRLPIFSESQIREFSLKESRNIYNMYMRIVTREEISIEVLEKILHLAIIITKLSIQASFRTCVTNQEILKETKKRMSKQVATRFSDIIFAKNNLISYKMYDIDKLNTIFSMVDGHIEYIIKNSILS